ncbi:MAG: lysophospholipid acyltransferase family protein [Pseudomonadota bacterium]
MTSTPARPPSSELTWSGGPPPPLPRQSLWQRLRMGVRAVTLVVVTYVGMVPVLISRWVEPRGRSPVWLTMAHLWGKVCLWLCGARVRREGVPIDTGLLMSNHTGWIDIFALLAAERVVFVSKAEVARWPVVGPLSRQIGTVYIERRRSQAKQQQSQLLTPLGEGRRVVLFPEGTSTDGQRVLPFRSSLFAAAQEAGCLVQPVSVVYHARAPLPPSFYGWWGDMALGPHLKAVFALASGNRVDVVFHPALDPAEFPDRKALAAACEDVVRAGLTQRLPG